MYTTAFGKKVKRVHSFECSPKSFNFLCANFLLHDLSYKYYIRDPLDGGGNGISGFACDVNTETIDVPTITLDSLGLTNINFIKIDVEGHEEQVLRGAVKTLKENNYPRILFESWPERYEDVPAKTIRNSLFDFLSSLGYKVIQVNGGTDDMFLAEHV
jgi:FkbM family methyltransferase